MSNTRFRTDHATQTVLIVKTVSCVHYTCLILALIFASQAGSRAAFAQSASPDSPRAMAEQKIVGADRQVAAELESDTAQLLLDLTSSPSFKVRERAMLSLWADYTQSRTSVESLATSSDPEVARRARWILNRWEIGYLPDVPWDVRQKLASSAKDPAGAFQTLLDSKRIHEAVEVARIAMENTDSQPLRGEIAEIVAQRFTQLVYMSLQTDQMDRMIDLLEVSAETVELAVARVILLERLGRSPSKEQILPYCAGNWPVAQQQKVEIICTCVLGRFDDAIALAEKLPEPALLSRVLLAAGRWDELAVLSSECVETDLPVDATINQYATWIVAARFAGRDDEVAAVTALLADSENLAAGGSSVRWKALAAAGQLDAAIETAKSLDKFAAIELMRTQMRFDEAFELLELNPANPQPDIERMFQAAAEHMAAKKTPGQAPATDAEAMNRLTTSLELLHSVGSHALVRPTLLRIAELRDSERLALHGRLLAILTAKQLGLTDLIPEIMAPLGPPGAEESNRLSSSLAQNFAKRSRLLFARSATAVGQVKPELDAVGQWRALFQLLSGTLPSDWDRQFDLDRLYEAMAIKRDPSEQLLATMGASYTIAEFFSDLGRGDIAEECYTEAIGPLYNTTAGMEFAIHQLNVGRPQAALQLLDVVNEQLGMAAQFSRYRPQDPSDAALPTASSVLLAKSMALRRLGQIEDAELIEKALFLAPFQPSEEAAEEYFERMIEFSELGRIEADIPISLRFCVLDSDNPWNLYSRSFRFAYALAESSPKVSYHWFQIGFAGYFSKLELNTRSYTAIPAVFFATKALAAAREGDREMTLQSLSSARRHFPLDITMAEETLLKLRELGMNQVADQVVDATFETGLKYLQHFPNDANTLNNLAWVSSINGRNYEQSLELAKLAVFLEPDSVSYRDTLAEVLFRLNRVDEALAIERQCLLDSPGHWHLHEQIARFTADAPAE